MPYLRGLLVGLLIAGCYWVRADAPSATDSRAAFLKLIDRPRVEPNVEERPMTAPAGMVQTHVALDTEPGQRVPAILLKSENAAAGTRRPVVIILHGTGGKKEGNLALAKMLASKGFLAVAPDGRYHGERSKKGTGTDDYFPAIAQAFKDGKSHPWLYDTAYDVMRLIDYLQTRVDVDPKRIGLIGFSKGGMETYLARRRTSGSRWPYRASACRATDGRWKTSSGRDASARFRARRTWPRRRRASRRSTPPLCGGSTTAWCPASTTRSTARRCCR
jgi:dienelactone hydrolase